jgi:hypothetical protein
VPQKDAPIEDVLQFRRDFSEEREVCIRAVRNLQIRLSQTITDPRELVIGFEREIGVAVAELKSASRSRFRQLSTRTVLITIATGASYLGSDALELPSILASTAAVAAGYAVNVASGPTRPGREQSPFYYLYQLERKFPDVAL